MGIVIADSYLCLMVIVHELAIFYWQRKMGSAWKIQHRYEAASFPFERGGTRYSLKLLPLGGSCAIEGRTGGCGRGGLLSE